MTRARRSRGSPNEAGSYALRLLRYRSRSRNEIIGRLKNKGFGKEETGRTVQYLEEKGLIEDRTVAQELLRTAVEKKYLGKRGIRVFLEKRGIETEIINDTLSSHTCDIDIESAERFVRRRFKTLKNLPDHIVKRRLCAALQRRGFSSEVIRIALKSIDV